MVRTEHRLAALRFCFTIFGWAVVAFGWACLLSFSAADPPSTSIWPQNDPPHNLCRTIGAHVAFVAFHHLGVGAYPLCALLTLFVIGQAHGVRVGDRLLRAIGLLMVVASVASAGAMFIPPSDGYLLSGPGGTVGAVLGSLLATNLATLGSVIVLASTFLVGLILAADEIVLHALRGARWAGRNSGPVLSASGQAIVTAGAALRDGVQRVTDRLNAAPGPTAAPAGGRIRQLLLGTGEPEAEPTARKPAGARSNRTVAQPSVEPDDAALDDDSPDSASAPDSEPSSAAPAAGRRPASTHAADAGRATDRPAAPQHQLDEEDDLIADAPGAIAAERAIDGAALSSAPLLVRPMQAKPARSNPAADLPKPDENYELPPLSLLDELVPVNRDSIESACREKAFVLEQTLNEFKLEVQVVAIETGPVITVFELRLAPGIKVSQIVSLSNDLARALRAPAVRVVAPLPGKNTIGIEVPNIDKEKVRLRELMLATPPRSESHAIPLYLGKDASGAPLVGDLTKMPHLLVAGTTGSGKSVCISSIVMSILLSRTPGEVNLILVDPKVVELSVFKDVPHLMCPIVTEMSKAESILDWATTKMDERYALLAEVGVKDIRSYNRLGEAGLRERLGAGDEDMAKIPVQLPYIVIIIDELADLMMTSAKEVEFYLCRLAQKSRAVGIHLIVSTQRPQANVVTGLIKSNLPSRIAFRVSSRLDSRIVLDQNGGEVLMGQGDMLYLPPGSAKLVRAQGTFIGDDELRRIVKHVRQFGEPRYHPELVRIPDPNAANATERDELFDQAVEIILETGRGSVSLLQRRLNIGYGRASRLVDQMAMAGIVGDYKGSQAREIAITKEEWAAIKRQRDSEESAETADE
ncbi:MAG: DNA translocase FtsK [Phycisphaerales bacterium]|nr:DNA translocase FtsK [Phycisphaerales bacterium]